MEISLEQISKTIKAMREDIKKYGTTFELHVYTKELGITEGMSGEVFLLTAIDIITDAILNKEKK